VLRIWRANGQSPLAIGPPVTQPDADATSVAKP
jgi:hypothetical protein